MATGKGVGRETEPEPEGAEEVPGLLGPRRIPAARRYWLDRTQGEQNRVPGSTLCKLLYDPTGGYLDLELQNQKGLKGAPRPQLVLV